MTITYTPVIVAGNTTIHAGVPNGRYSSGSVRYRKLCASSSRNERHWPAPLQPGTPVTCKRCIAKIGAK